MTATLPATKLARRNQVAKSSEDVQAMLFDIATVLRMTAKVKGELLREQAEADRIQLEANRAKICADFAAL